MSYIETFPVQHSTIMRIYSEKDEILLNPDYQRMGGGVDSREEATIDGLDPQRLRHSKDLSARLL